MLIMLSAHSCWSSASQVQSSQVLLWIRPLLLRDEHIAPEPLKDVPRDWVHSRAQT